MTLTNNTRRIEQLANDVNTLCDRHEYEKAHCALDDIEAKVHALRRHVDNLQLIADRAARPAGPPNCPSSSKLGENTGRVPG